VLTYRAIIPKEYANDEVKAKIADYLQQIHKLLRPSATAEDVEDAFEDIETPIYEPYQDDETKPYIISDRG